MVLRTEIQCCKATLPAAARKWERYEVPRSHALRCGLFAKLLSGGLDVNLMQYLNARDMAKLSKVNSLLRRLSLLFCAERLRFFLGLSRSWEEERAALANDQIELELASLPMVSHFLERCEGIGASLPRLLHVVSHCREQTYRTTLALGEAHTAVVLRPQTLTSSVVLFGEGSHGQLGNSSDQGSVLPRPVDLSNLSLCPADLSGQALGSPMTVACGAFHTAILTDCGRLVTFGFNNAGQLGYLSRDPPTAQSTPKLVPSRFVPRIDSNSLRSASSTKIATPVRYTQVVAGRFYTAAITECGRVAVFGEGLECDLSLGFLLKPGDVDIRGGEKIIQLAAGQEHLLMRSDRNRVFAIGNGAKGKLGIAQNLVVPPEEAALPDAERSLFAKMRLDAGCRVPRLVERAGFENEHVVQIAAGGNHSAMVTADGHLYTWGGASYGELGHGTFARCVPKPSRVFLPKESPFALHVSCGRAHSAVLTSCGRIVTFGDGAHRQDGKSNRFFATSTPQGICLGELETHREDLSSVVCGGRHSATIDAQGGLFTFGDPLCTGRVFRRRSTVDDTNHLPKSVQLSPEERKTKFQLRTRRVHSV